MNEWVIVVDLGNHSSNQINERIISQLFDQKMTVSEVVADLKRSYSPLQLQKFIKARRRYDCSTYWYLGLSALVLVVAVIYWGCQGFSGLDLTRISFSFGLAVVLIVSLLLMSASSVRKITQGMKEHQKNWQKYAQVVETLDMSEII